ncbi:WhiB family transcriptional regulator [Marinitenerispora sediminis]|uniref:Transcriptional regulator WhiB n=2 Tax=Marinitenerispora sediminis TaxID=1931232 RepID=A0A368T6S0_9ACTN|nr:WhiB family transcriptional regulator [Marinitenerispora sediminis]RCV51196.1 WhiB family transcriptional regulator [Marinitenerispora sediminis]RCV59348.1 WhiB family transcriptional regulator [Marinitenerispora sediminis]
MRRIASGDRYRWQDDAACRGADTELFFTPGYESVAKAICAQCPVRAECLDYAVSRPEKYGMWGGLDEQELAAERKRRQRQATSRKEVAA